PVRLVKFHAVPPQIHAAEELRQAHALALWFRVSEHTSRIEQSDKAMDVGMLCEKRPVEPAGFVILAIGIVISKLCSPHFVAHEKHGHTDRKHRYVRKFFTCRFRSFSTPGLSVGPSNPQFQLRLSFVPSRLFSPFVSLCLVFSESR